VYIFKDSDQNDFQSMTEKNSAQLWNSSLILWHFLYILKWLAWQVCP